LAAAITFGGGVLLGFASSLHCIGMCGGIALLLGLPPARRRAENRGGRIGALASTLAGHVPLHLGRALAYMTLGGLAGGIGAAAIGAVAMEQAHLFMRWAAAMALAWVGFSVLGLMPSPATVGHALLPRMGYGHPSLSLPTPLARLMTGLGWGFMPCGMVYGALLFAAFAGSALGGMAVMGGFALGTMPSLMLVHGGHAALARFARRAQARWITGAAILFLALLSLLAPETGFRAFCRSLGLPV